MLDDAVAYMAEEVAMDASRGTTPTRFLYHFLHPSNPVYSPSFISNSDAISKYRAEAEEEFDYNTKKAIKGPPPAPIPTDGAERYAGFVWKEMIGMGGFRVVCKSREEIEKEKEKEKMEGGGKEKKQKKGKGKEKVKSVESPRVAFDLDPDTDANQMDIDPLISNPDLEPAPNDEEDGEDGEPPLTSVNDQPTRDVDSRPGNRLSGGRIKTLPKDQRYRMTDIRRGRKEQAKIFSANDASPAGEDPDAMDVDLEGGENQTGAGGKSKENAGTGGKGKDGGKTVFLKGHEAGDFAALRVREQAGDAVVMKASDERILMALTGSFQRPRGLTPNIFAVLEAISRARGEGQSTIQIGAYFKVDQGTAFYMLKVSVELGYVAKIPCQEKIETGSRLTNVGVHRKYLSQNPEWQLRLKLSHELGAEGDDVDGAIGGPGANGGDEDGEELNEEIALETQRPALSVIGEDMYSGLPIFTPCGSADLRMYPFARERILTCLRAPKLLNHLLLNLDLIAAIGVRDPVKADRRVLQRYIKKMINEGLIDLVEVPNDETGVPHRCLRSREFRPSAVEGGADADYDAQLSRMVEEADAAGGILGEDGTEEDGFDPHTLTFSLLEPAEYRCFQKVKEAGLEGITYAELSARLNNMDRKIVESVLQRYDVKMGLEFPSHLAEWGIISSQENEGRERRIRTYTLKNYLELQARRGRAPEAKVPTSLPPDNGRWSSLDGLDFYKSVAEYTYRAADYPYKPSRPDAIPKWQAKAFIPKANQDDDWSDQENYGLADMVAAPSLSPVQTPKPRKSSGRPQAPRRPRMLHPDRTAPGIAPTGRPRKFIKMIGLDGKLVPRKPKNVVPRHDLLPATMMWNAQTGVFFFLPDDYKSGPPEEPPDWHTRQEPKVVYIPGTKTKPALPSTTLKQQKKLLQQQKAEAKAEALAQVGAERAAEKAAGKTGRAAVKAGKRKRGGTEDTSQASGETGNHGAIDLDGDDPEDVATRPIKRPRKTVVEVEVDVPSRHLTPSEKTVMEVPATRHPDDTSLATPNPASKVPEPIGTTSPPAATSEVRTFQKVMIKQPRKGPRRAADQSASTTSSIQQSVDAQIQQPGVNASVAPHSADAETSFASPRVIQAARPLLATEDIDGDEDFVMLDSSVAEDGVAGPSGSSAHNAITLGSPTVQSQTPAAAVKVTKERPAKKARVRALKGVTERFNLDDSKAEAVAQYLEANGRVCGAEMALSKSIYQWQSKKASSHNKPSQMARETIKKITNVLIKEEKVMQRAVVITDDYGGRHKMDIICLSTATQADIDAWSDDETLRRSRLPTQFAQTRKKNNEQAFTRTPRQDGALGPSGEAPNDPSRDSIQTPPEADHTDIRREMLRDWRVVAQLYGYTGGIVGRARDLHAFSVDYALRTPEFMQGDSIIIPTKFFIDHLPVSMMAKVVAISQYSPALEAMIKDPHQGQWPISNINVRRHLTMYRTARCRVLKVLQILVDEQMVRPCILPSAAGLHKEYTTQLDKATHFHFLSAVPVYVPTSMNSQSSGEPAPLTTILPVRNGQDVRGVWNDIWRSSTSKDPVFMELLLQELRGKGLSLQEAGEPSFDASRSPSRDLTSPKVWTTAYVMTPRQKTILKAMVGFETAKSPLDEEGALERAAHDVAAPRPSVEHYLGRIVHSVRKELAIKSGEPQPLRTVKVSKAAIASRIQSQEETKRNSLEAKWQTDLEGVLRSLGQSSTLELRRFLEPIRLEAVAGTRTLGRSQLRLVVEAHCNKMIELQHQKTRRLQEVRPSASALQIVQNMTPKGQNTRTRWTPIMEELLRDGFVIIEHRIAQLNDTSDAPKRFEAFLKLFPGSTNVKSLRDRLVRWRKEDANNANYLENLADSWSSLYERLKGTPSLPDPNPVSVSEFPVADWVVVLRQNVRKGLLSRIQRVKEEVKQPQLPTSIKEVTSVFAIQAKPETRDQSSELIWRLHISDERRARGLHQNSSALASAVDGVTALGPVATTAEEGKIVTAVKMVVGTPIDQFSTDKAADFLKPFKAEDMVELIEKMDRAKILTRADRSRGHGPEYVFADKYLRETERPHPAVVHRDAEHMIDTLPEVFRGLRLNATAGDFAGFLSLVSENMLDIEIDTSDVLQELQVLHGLSTKELDDDLIEISMEARKVAEGKPADVIGQLLSHGATLPVPDSPSPSDEELEIQLVENVHAAGVEGIRIDALQSVGHFDPIKLISTIEKHLRLESPGFILVGYEYPTLVGVDFVEGHWSLACPSIDAEETEIKVPPRQWFDMYGRKIETAWEDALRCMRGYIVQRPGISEHDLRELVSFTLDRLEVNDLLQILLDEQKIYRTFASETIRLMAGVEIIGLADPEAENGIHYFPDPLW